MRARFVARTETTRRLRSLHPLCGKSRPHPIQLEAPASHRHTRRLWRLLRWLRVDAVRQLVGGHAGPVVRSSSTALDGQIYWGVEAKQWEPAPPWRGCRDLAALPPRSRSAATGSTSGRCSAEPALTLPQTKCHRHEHRLHHGLRSHRVAHAQRGAALEGTSTRTSTQACYS